MTKRAGSYCFFFDPPTDLTITERMNVGGPRRPHLIYFDTGVRLILVETRGRAHVRFPR